MKRKGAMELSVGTIVIIVLAMSMLILGLVLVKNIFSGSTQNILQINDKVKGEIEKLFVEDKKIVIYLPNQIAKIEQGDEWGVAIGIKNLNRGTSESEKFSYKVEIDKSFNSKEKCSLSSSDIEKWIVTGQSRSTTLSPGATYFGIIRFEIPEDAPLCTASFVVDVSNNGVAYTSSYFDVRVEA